MQRSVAKMPQTTGGLCHRIHTLETQEKIPLARWEQEYLLDTKLKAEWAAPTTYNRAKGYLHTGSQILVPEGLQKLVVQQYHDGCHLGERDLHTQKRDVRPIS